MENNHEFKVWQSVLWQSKYEDEPSLYGICKITKNFITLTDGVQKYQIPKSKSNCLTYSHG
jgi:hypothetical protein